MDRRHTGGNDQHRDVFRPHGTARGVSGNCGRVAVLGGMYELRTKCPNKYGGSGNQCIYDGCGKLITNRPGAGTADYSSPEGERSHVRDDVKPFDERIC